MKFTPKDIELTHDYPKRWGRMRDVLRLFPFGRTEIFRLIKLGAIKSYLYKTPAGTNGKGIRIFDLDSVAELLEKQAKEVGQ